MADSGPGSIMGHQVLDLHRKVLREKLKPMHLIPYIKPFLSNDACTAIRRANKKSQSEAVDVMIDQLREKNEQGWFAAFKDALRHAEFDFLVKLLEGSNTVPEQHQQFYKNLIDIFYPELTSIDAQIFCAYLKKHNTLSGWDMEGIIAIQRSEGAKSAALMLLTEIANRQEDWFPMFVHALNGSGYKHISELLDEQFPNAESYESIQNHAVDVVALHTGEKTEDEIEMAKQRNRRNKCAVSEVRMEYEEEGSSSHGLMATNPTAHLDNVEEEKRRAREDDTAAAAGTTFAAGYNREHRVTVRGEPSMSPGLMAGANPPAGSEEHDDDITYVKQRAQAEDAQRTSVPLSRFQQLEESTEWRQQVQDHNLDETGESNDNRVPNKEVVNSLSPKVQSSFPSPSLLSSDSAADKILNISNMEQAQQSVRPKEFVNPQPVTPAPPPELQLRPDQLELVQEAQHGKNVIIVAPTGSGKTYIALWITKEHFAAAEEYGRRPKVAFIVPTVALVEQQCSLFRRYLPSLRCLPLSGDTVSSKPSLSLLMPKYDVFVLTPVILLDSANDMDPIDAFSLLFLDECHHTMKDHPYNKVMQLCLEAKLAQQIPRPQIVGLTASVGVGKRANLEGAVEHIVRLCAHLDAQKLCTVRRHVDSLRQHSSQPVQDTTQVRGRAEDPFHDQVTEIMNHIEHHMKSQPGIHTVPEEQVSDLPGKLEAPSKAGSEAYTQWVSSLHKQIAKIYDQTIRQVLMPCYQELRIYNEALLLNSDCRTKDALEYIQEERKQLVVNSESTRAWLSKIYQEKLPLLRKVSKDPKYDNPKLVALKAKIATKMEDDTRTIIFCKTRKLAMALVKWMTEDSELARLRPHHLTGSNAKASRGGMTGCQQEDVLKYFRNGAHKVIVATSVAEEGLDVRKCDLVIRYEHVTNETAMIQARGRGRADDAEYHLLTETGSGAAHREDMNKIKETLMNQAIKHINSLPEITLLQNIERAQQSAKRERDMKEQEEQRKREMLQNKPVGQWQLRCLECDHFAAMADDVRKVKDSHHVVTDPDIVSRCILSPHPRPLIYDEFVKCGKLYCSNCRYDWGILAKYRSVPLAVIKVVSFVLVDPYERRSTCKRWKDAPFAVLQLEDEQLQIPFQWRMSNLQQNDEEEEGDEHWG